MKKAASFALGCKVNQYESEAIAELFQEKGYEIVSIDEEADVYVINTCTVTNFGDKKSRQLIRKVKRQNENAIVAVVGCYHSLHRFRFFCKQRLNLSPLRRIKLVRCLPNRY